MRMPRHFRRFHTRDIPIVKTAPRLQKAGDILISRSQDGTDPTLLLILDPAYILTPAGHYTLNPQETLVLDSARLSETPSIRQKLNDVVSGIPPGDDMVELSRYLKEALIDPLLSEEMEELVYFLAEPLEDCSLLGTSLFYNPTPEAIRKVLLDDTCIALSCVNGYITDRLKLFVRWPNFLTGLPNAARWILEADFKRGGFSCPWCMGYDNLRNDLILWLGADEVGENGMVKKQRDLVKDVAYRLDRLNLERRELGYSGAWSVSCKADDEGGHGEGEGESPEVLEGIPCCNSPFIST